MKIGIDLDNTIINYEEVFPLFARSLGFLDLQYSTSKVSIRKQLLEQEDGELRWRRLQGQVYGAGVQSARLYPGIYRFLWRCRARGIEVHVLSHKTRFGHGDSERIPLRREAIRFLQENKLFSKAPDSLIAKVYFFDSQNDKVNAIKEARFSWFIDDLSQILTDSRIPSCTKPILFLPQSTDKAEYCRTARSWVEIEGEIFNDWSKTELGDAAQEIAGAPAGKVRWLGKHGNSGIAKVSFATGTVAALKIYSPDRTNERLYAEYQAVELIRELGNKSVPKPLGLNTSLGMGLYEWISGESNLIVEDGAIKKVLKFLRFLHEPNVRSKFSKFPDASAAVFSGQQLVDQINMRISEFHKGDVPFIIRNFVTVCIEPALMAARERAEEVWTGANFSEELERHERVLSPSDLGAHNWLHCRIGGIYFLDFEYFGWDDPAKLVCDFLLHPGMELDGRARESWINGVQVLYGQSALQRAAAMYGLIAVAWSLIVLNQFKKADDVSRKMEAAGLFVQEKILEKQLMKSKRMLTNVCFPSAPF